MSEFVECCFGNVWRVECSKEFVECVIVCAFNAGRDSYGDLSAAFWVVAAFGECEPYFFGVFLVVGEDDFFEVVDAW